MDEKEKKAQEKYMEFQQLDQHIKQMHQQLEAVTNQIMEMQSTSNSIEEFKKAKKGSEAFVPLNNGIFARATITDTTQLLVNVGANTVVQKDVDSAKKLIDEQVEEVKKVHSKIVGEIEKLTSKAEKMQMELQSLVG